MRFILLKNADLKITNTSDSATKLKSSILQHLQNIYSLKYIILAFLPLINNMFQQKTGIKTSNTETSVKNKFLIVCT